MVTKFSQATKILTNGDDNYTDSPFRNTYIVGLAGNDIINGEDGDDIIYGDNSRHPHSSGNDTIHGGSGNDKIYGGAGNDILSGDDGSDTVYGGDGEDKLYADDDDQIDILNGGRGNDTFYGGILPQNLDVLRGGIGDDIYYLGGSGFNKVIEKFGEGIDTVILDDFSTVTLPANVENLLIIYGGSGTGNSLDNIMMAGPGTAVGFYGLAGNDTLTGDDRGDRLYGDSGNDILDGGAGDDILTGGTGNDILKSATIKVDYSGELLSDKDILIGGMGDDVYYTDRTDIIIENMGEGIDNVFVMPTSIPYSFELQANLENLTIMNPKDPVNEAEYWFGSGNDLSNTIQGNNYNNRLYGQGGNDFLIGADGNDFFDGGSGLDKLDGGAGNDEFKYDPMDFGSGAQENQYFGGTGTDILNLQYDTPTLDLTKMADNLIRGIDVISFGVQGENSSVTLTAKDVLAISDNGTLRIEAGSGPTPQSVYSENQGWTLDGTQVINDETYNVFKVGQATLLLDANLATFIS